MKSSLLYQQFKTSMAALNPTQRVLCVALSGGVDSVVLLHLCTLLREEFPELSVEAIYVHHGLSPHASEWQRFCAQLCEQLHVPFQFKKVKVERKARQSIESQARDARYMALDELASHKALLLLGQHGDDQLETFLLRLKRGSGLLGLGAMKPQTQLKSGRVCIRPLLNIGRDEIEAFATEYQITHIEDESNRRDDFDRNFLRNQVIPLLKSRFSGLLPSTLRSIQLLQQQQLLIDEISTEDLAQCIKRCNNALCLDIHQLGQLSELRQNNVVRAWLKRLQVAMPSQIQLSQIRQQALMSKEGAQLRIELKVGSVRRHRGLLYWVVEQEVPQAHTNIGLNTIQLSTDRTLSVSQGRGVREPNDGEVVSVRYGRLKEKFRPYLKPGRNTLKHWLKDAGIPVWQREQVPLIYYNDELVQVVGYYTNHDYFVADSGIYWKVNYCE